MKSNTFYSADGLKREIRKRARAALENEIADYVKEDLKQHIEKDVYNSYSPVVYDRRQDSNGLTDNRNIIAEVKGSTLTVYEAAEIEGPRLPGHEKFPESDGLAKLIEHGAHNPWNHRTRYRWMKPRPFVTRTQRDINHKYAKIVAMLKERIENGT